MNASAHTKVHRCTLHTQTKHCVRNVQLNEFSMYVIPFIPIDKKISSHPLPSRRPLSVGRTRRLSCNQAKARSRDHPLLPSPLKTNASTVPFTKCISINSHACAVCVCANCFFENNIVTNHRTTHCQYSKTNNARKNQSSMSKA